MQVVALALVLVVACDSKEAGPAQTTTEDAQTVALPTDAAVPADAIAASVDAIAAVVAAAASPTKETSSKADETGKGANVRPSKDRERCTPEHPCLEGVIGLEQRRAAGARYKTKYGKDSETDQGAGLDKALPDVLKSDRRGPISTEEPPKSSRLVSRVRFTVIAVDETTLEEDQVRKRIRTRYLSGIKRCHAVRLKADPTLKGVVRARLTVGSSGRTTKSTVSGFDKSIDKCIKGLIKKWRFDVPKDDSGKPTSAKFALQLLLKSG